jgi:PPOX class probable FMN-dependent enzyme
MDTIADPQHAVTAEDLTERFGPVNPRAAVSAGFTDLVTSVEELRQLLGHPSEVVLRKEMTALDQHCRDFIKNAPFLLLATASAVGQCTVSPKGDAPGFVHVLDDRTIAIPDRPGNKRIDGLRNIVENPHVGLIFLIPKVKQTLRINGRACITRDRELLAQMEVNGKVPLLAIGVEVEQVFLHCPKALLRSNLWEAARRDEEPPLASFACMIAAHTGQELTPEMIQSRSEEAMRAQLY